MYVATYYYTLLMLMGDDIDPSNAGEFAYLIVIVLIGACVNATIFANVATLVTQITSDASEHQRQCAPGHSDQLSHPQPRTHDSTTQLIASLSRSKLSNSRGD